jgi:hypothetical protein
MFKPTIKEEVKLEIRYEEMFKPTDETPIYVILNKEKFKKLCNTYGIYGIDWYFIDEKYIKYFNPEKQEWIETTIYPNRIITLKEVSNSQ